MRKNSIQLTTYNINGQWLCKYCQKYGLTFLLMEEQSMLHIMFVLLNGFTWTVNFDHVPRDHVPRVCDENLKKLIFPFSGHMYSIISQAKVNHTKPNNFCELILTNSAL